MFCVFLAGERTRRPRCSSAARPNTVVVVRSVVDIVVFIGYIGDICRCFMFCVFLAGERTRRPRCSSAARPPPDTRQTKLIRLIPTPAPIPATRLLRISRK